MKNLYPKFPASPQRSRTRSVSPDRTTTPDSFKASSSFETLEWNFLRILYTFSTSAANSSWLPSVLVESSGLFFRQTRPNPLPLLLDLLGVSLCFGLNFDGYCGGDIGGVWEEKWDVGGSWNRVEE